MATSCELSVVSSSISHYGSLVRNAVSKYRPNLRDESNGWLVLSSKLFVIVWIKPGSGLSVW